MIIEWIREITEEEMEEWRPQTQWALNKYLLNYNELTMLMTGYIVMPNDKVLMSFCSVCLCTIKRKLINTNDLNYFNIWFYVYLMSMCFKRVWIVQSLAHSFMFNYFSDTVY